MSRGPSGQAPPPPADLATSPLPVTALLARTALLRIHRIALGPIHFSPGRGRPPAGRFDSASGAFGVLYAALSFEGAFVETVLRNPARRLVGMGEITARALATLHAPRALRLVDLRGAGLQHLGLDAAILSGPYDPCGLWSDALFAHPEKPDGILYPSRHDPSQGCVALFERPGLRLRTTAASEPLDMHLGTIGTVLRRYGKALDP